MRSLRLLPVSLLLAAGTLRAAAGEPPPDPEPAREKRTIRLAYTAGAFSDLDVRDTRLAVDLLVGKLVKRMGVVYGMESAVCNGDRELLDRLESGKADFAVLLAKQYLDMKDEADVDPVAVSVRGEAASERFVLLVRNSGPPPGLGALKGARLAADTGGKGDIALTWLDTLLLAKELPAARSLAASISRRSKSSEAILPVFFKQADACVVTEASFRTAQELNPQLGRRLTVLATSEPLLCSLLCCRRGMNAEDRRALVSACLSLHETVEGRQVLTMFQIARLAPFEEGQLRQTAELYKAHAEADAKAEAGRTPPEERAPPEPEGKAGP